ncbi:MAG: metallophosphoesterase family protein [Ignavibacteriales bacterium]|nr:metallophosphoesterase family protein [Ignavibacteriales bacterium]
MRIAIISDIHSNFEALKKTFEIIDTENVDKIICLGDIIGYGANPNECMDLIRNRTKEIIMGNHEYVILNPAELSHFTTNARIAALWTSNILSKENKIFIESLQRYQKLDNLLFVHSSPYEMEEWHYLISSTDREMNYKHFDENICFFGHTHFPGIYNEHNDDRKIDKERKFLINVGSVGQPRDHNPQLSFGIFDIETWSYENIRSEYDYNSASEKIKNAGLPTHLAERILIGK